MTKLVKYLIIGGSTTAVVGGGAAGAAVALSHKSSSNKDNAQEQARKAIEQQKLQQAFDANFDASAKKGGIEIKKEFEFDEFDRNFDNAVKRDSIEMKKDYGHAEEVKETYSSYKNQLVADQTANPQIAAALAKVEYDPSKTAEENQLIIEKVLEQEVAKVELANKNEFNDYVNGIVKSINDEKEPSATLVEIVKNFEFNSRETVEFNRNQLVQIIAQIKTLVLDNEHGEDKANEMSDRLNKNVYLHTHHAEFNKIFQAVLSGTITAEYVYSTYPDQHELTDAYDALDKIPYIHEHPSLLESTFKRIEDGSTTLQAVETDYGITK